MSPFRGLGEVVGSGDTGLLHFQDQLWRRGNFLSRVRLTGIIEDSQVVDEREEVDQVDFQVPLTPARTLMEGEGITVNRVPLSYRPARLPPILPESH